MKVNSLLAETIDTVTLGRKHGLDIYKIREDFPMLNYQYNGNKLIYFDSAATNHKPVALINKLHDLYTTEYGKPQEEHELSKKMTQEVENVRSKIAKFIKADDAKQIIFTSGCTEGINIVAHGFGHAILKENDEILITELEHHANICPWQMAAEQSGAHLVVAPVDRDGILDLKKFEELISDRTRVIAVSHTSHVLGTILPVQQIIKLAHQRNIPVLIDAAQSAPHMPINVGEMDCDFLTFSAHKMGGPAGVGILYGKKEWLEKIPPHYAGSENAKKVTYGKTEFEDIPKKFEPGTSAFEEVVSLGALIDYVQDLDMEKTSAYERDLLDYFTEQMLQIDEVAVFGLAPEKEPVLSFTVAGSDVKKVEKFLSENYNISVRGGELSAQPFMKLLGVDGLLRASVCYYNTTEEIDVFVSAIKDHISQK
jgi:cysteine desulfurase/selenocysteine lyase